MDEPVIDMCEMGHRFAKLDDHPTKDGSPRCPHCMALGLDAARAQNERQLAAILSYIDEGVDELLVRRIWERALRA
jgi:hypothetical protein